MVSGPDLVLSMRPRLTGTGLVLDIFGVPADVTDNDGKSVTICTRRLSSGLSVAKRLIFVAALSRLLIGLPDVSGDRTLTLLQTSALRIRGA